MYVSTDPTSFLITDLAQTYLSRREGEGDYRANKLFTTLNMYQQIFSPVREAFQTKKRGNLGNGQKWK